MYNLIIGYNKGSINLINNFIAKGEVVFLIDSKETEDIQIKNKCFYYYKIEITDMKQVFDKASKNMLSKVFIATEDDYLNLMIAEILKGIDNVYAIYNVRAFEKLLPQGEKNFFLEDFFQRIVDGDE